MLIELVLFIGARVSEVPGLVLPSRWQSGICWLCDPLGAKLCGMSFCSLGLLDFLISLSYSALEGLLFSDFVAELLKFIDRLPFG